jgi:hypothetical protein
MTIKVPILSASEPSRRAAEITAAKFMANIDVTWCCTCGTTTKLTSEQASLGRVFQCPGCQGVFAHVYPQGGGRAWIRVPEDQVKFHGLVKERGHVEADQA